MIGVISSIGLTKMSKRIEPLKNPPGNPTFLEVFLKLNVMTVRIRFGLLFLVSVIGMILVLYGYIIGGLYFTSVGLSFVLLPLVLYLNCQVDE